MFFFTLKKRQAPSAWCPQFPSRVPFSGTGGEKLPSWRWLPQKPWLFQPQKWPTNWSWICVCLFWSPCQQFPLLFFCWASRPGTWLWAHHASFSTAWNLPFGTKTPHSCHAFLGKLRSGIHTKQCWNWWSNIQSWQNTIRLQPLHSQINKKCGINKSFNVQTPPNFAENKQFTTATATDFLRAQNLQRNGTFTGSTQAGFEGLERGMGGKKNPMDLVLVKKVLAYHTFF